MFRVKSMKMRRAVIPPEHLDYDTIKNANRRHMPLLSGFTSGGNGRWALPHKEFEDKSASEDAGKSSERLSQRRIAIILTF